jgi:hypothetical protein
MDWRATAMACMPVLKCSKTWPPGGMAVLSDAQTSLGIAGSTMAWGEKRVFSPFFLAGWLVGGATGLSRSGGEGR